MGPLEQQGGTLSTTARTTTGGETTLNQKVAIAFGAIYILVGILGFFFTDKFIGPAEGDKLLGIFAVNHLHNIVHLLIGVVLFVSGRAGDRQARSMNMTIGAIYLLLGVLGWFIDGDGAINFVNLNPADHILHLLSGAVLVGVSRAGATTGTRAA
jgi:Domain of unknown function (DUF4383)